MFLILKQNYAQNTLGFISAQAIGDGLGGIDNGNCVKVDLAGNIYVIGDFQGMVDFDPSPAFGNLTAISTGTNIADSDIFFAKYSPLGTLIWAKKIGSSNDDEGHYIDISPNGNVTITGFFSGTVDFDPSSSVANLVAPGETVFLAQYDQNGNYIWAGKLFTAAMGRCQGLNSDAAGNIFISGFFTYGTDFDPSPAVVTLTPAATNVCDIFIAKYDGSGNYLWAKNVGGTGYDFSYSQILDNTGNLYITGTFSTTTDFDPSPATATIATAGLNDIFIAKYDPLGNYVWAKSLGSIDEEAGKMLAKDNSGNIYLTGFYTNSLDFDPSPSTAILSVPFTTQIFIAKYDQNGNYLLCANAGFSNVFGAQSYITIDNLNNIFIGLGNQVYKLNSFCVFQFSMFAFSSSSQVLSIAINASNDLIVAGSFATTALFNNNTTLTSLVASSFYMASYNNSGNVNWCFASRDGTSYGFEKGTDIKTDASGNVYVTGTFDGEVDFDPSAASLNIASNNSSQDIFFSKYNSAGNLLWVKKIGGKQGDGGKVLLELDANGNIYLTGHFSDTTDFDPSPATASLVGYPAGGARVFFAKYDNSGNYIWAKAIDGHQVNNLNVVSDVVSNGIGIDNIGNVFLTGNFRGVLDFDPSAATFDQTSQNGDYDMFFAKYDVNGNYLWAKQIGGYLYADRSQALKMDASGNLLIAGEFRTTCDFDPSVATANFTSAGGTDDVFIAKYDPAGNYVWAKIIGGAVSADAVYSMVLNSSNEIFLTGDFGGTCDFDPSASVANLSPVNGNPDSYIAKYDASGNYLWAKSFGGTDPDHSAFITLDANQNIYITGYFKNIADFDPSPSVLNLIANSGSEDGYIAKYDPSGNYLFAANFGGPNNMESGTSIACDANSNVSITGYFRGVTDFNFGSATNNLESTDTWPDIFIAKYASCSSSVTASSPSLTALSPTICLYSNTNLTVSSGTLNAAANWQWYTNSCGGLSVGSGTAISVSPTVATVFYARGEGPCVNAGPCATVAINVNPLPVIVVSGTSSVCVGSSANFTVAGANTYTWNTNANTATINVLPLVTSTYSVSGTDVNNCVNTQTGTLNVNNTCADVWPGDANSDGIADNLDVLELGLHFTQTGAARTPTSNNWQSYYANNWAGLITNGKNLSHSDCNGSGLIDQDDTLAIFNNYGFLHAFKENSQTITNPQLHIMPDQTFVIKGNWGSASIYFGDSLNPINNVNGLAYTMAFDKTYIEQDSVYIKYPTSFLNTNNQNLNFRKRNFNNGVIYTATTHTNNLNVSGYGKVATFYFKVKSSLTIDTAFNMNILQANQSSANGVITPLTVGSASLLAIGATVNMKENSKATNISIYPNPTKNTLRINSSKDILKIEVLSITGQILLNETGKGNSQQINLEMFANGTYFIKVYSTNEPAVQKIIIKN